MCLWYARDTKLSVAADAPAAIADDMVQRPAHQTFMNHGGSRPPAPRRIGLCGTRIEASSIGTVGSSSYHLTVGFTARNRYSGNIHMLQSVCVSSKISHKYMRAIGLIIICIVHNHGRAS